LVPQLSICSIDGLAEPAGARMNASLGDRCGGDEQRHNLALAVADISWFTTENLFRELDEPTISILALRCMDYVNGWRRGTYPWSRTCRQRPWGHRSFVRDMVLPSGWMKRYPKLGMWPIARVIRDFWRGFDHQAWRGLVMTYPHYLYLHDRLKPDVSLYYNIDDYTLYWPRHAEQIRQLERKAVLRAEATVCVARYRADALRAAVPEAAEKIHHIPHGTPAAFLTAHPQHCPAAPPGDIAYLPRPLLGYVGSIEDRVDWVLMKKLGEAYPDASIVVIGRTPHFNRHREPWFHDYILFSVGKNVHKIGWRPQRELPRYYESFDVILMPYAREHPFNTACSPTKIMDGMGSGRPIVATAIPECRLYSHLFDVAEDTAGFLESVGAILENGSDDGRAGLRHAHARANTCDLVAKRVLATMGQTVATTMPTSEKVPR
jgi:glycosyltransferase involved in cell wall biosynthesis